MVKQHSCRKRENYVGHLFAFCKKEGNLSIKEEKYFDNFQFFFFNYSHIVSMMNTSRKNKEEKT